MRAGNKHGPAAVPSAHHGGRTGHCPLRRSILGQFGPVKRHDLIRGKGRAVIRFKDGAVGVSDRERSRKALEPAGQSGHWPEFNHPRAAPPEGRDCPCPEDAKAPTKAAARQISSGTETYIAASIGHKGTHIFPAILTQGVRYLVCHPTWKNNDVELLQTAGTNGLRGEACHREVRGVTQCMFGGFNARGICTPVPIKSDPHRRRPGKSDRAQ